MITSYLVRINGQEHLFQCCSTTLASENLLAWLEGQRVFPKFFWEANSSAAAAGALKIWSECPEIDSDPKGLLRIYGGTGFSQKVRKDDTWEAFPKGFFFFQGMS